MQPSEIEWTEGIRRRSPHLWQPGAFGGTDVLLNSCIFIKRTCFKVTKRTLTPMASKLCEVRNRADLVSVACD